MTQDLLSLFDCDEATLTRRVADALKGADDGELFVEHAQAESLTFDNGRLKGGSFNTDQGFGLRAVADEAVGYAIPASCPWLPSLAPPMRSAP